MTIKADCFYNIVFNTDLISINIFSSILPFKNIPLSLPFWSFNNTYLFPMSSSSREIKYSPSTLSNDNGLGKEIFMPSRSFVMVKLFVSGFKGKGLDSSILSKYSIISNSLRNSSARLFRYWIMCSL